MITRHEKIGRNVRGKIEIQFILEIASLGDAGSDFDHSDGDSFNSSDELRDYIIRQLPELVPEFEAD